MKGQNKLCDSAIKTNNYNIYITCLGGYGGNALLNGFKNARGANNYKWIGSHDDIYMLARSEAHVNYLLPSACNNKEEYINCTKKIIQEEEVDLFIPKSDMELCILASELGSLKCRTFLPDSREILATQDKLKFYDILEKNNVPAAKTSQIESICNIEGVLSNIPKVADKYWLRIKTAGKAGAYGATWTRNIDEIENWIIKWQKRQIKVSDFIISEYLPGRLFECILLYKNGILKLGKIYENIKFANGEVPANLGVGSTPGIAKTVSDEISVMALKNAIAAVQSTSNYTNTKSNGIYHLSAKVNKDNIPCITEVNIGRTPSTIEIFNSTGKYNISEYFLYYALDQDIDDPKEVFDLDYKEKYIIRSLDQRIQIKDLNQLNYKKL